MIVLTLILTSNNVFKAQCGNAFDIISRVFLKVILDFELGLGEILGCFLRHSVNETISVETLVE
jgi:hypothetical protein